MKAQLKRSILIICCVVVTLFSMLVPPTVLAAESAPAKVSAKASQKSKKSTESAKSLSLSKSSVTLQIKETHTLKVSNYSSSKLSWSSSDTKVAKVYSSGKVIAVGPGTCTITVKHKSNSSLRATCKVTVARPKPTKLKLNNTTLGMAYFGNGTGQMETLKVSFAPSNANKSVQWKSSNTKVAKVSSDGKVTATGAGTCIITVQSKVKSSMKATCKVVVKKYSAYSFYKSKMLPKMDTIYNTLKKKPEQIKSEIGNAVKAGNNLVAFCKMHPTLKNSRAMTYANNIKTYLATIQKRCKIDYKPNDSTLSKAIKNAMNTLKNLKSYCNGL